MKTFFTQKLMLWNKKSNLRAMPWKGEKDPYKIWLSEIILQQTRVEQGWDYYLKFVSAFPTVEILAQAPETKIFKLWEGLGYYSRCKNLIAAAKTICREYKGAFPSSYEKILALPGIGPYTASAIASFAFHLPHAVVDGNVQRVLSRIAGITIPVDTTEGKSRITQLANDLLDKKHPGLYNQAIMDFGASVCKPKAPLCGECIMQPDCQAYQLGLVEKIPVKEKKLHRKKRWFYYFIVCYKDGIYIKKRTASDIWQNLHEFVLLEKKGRLSKKALLLDPSIQWLLNQNKAEVAHFSGWYTQQLTHQTINGQFIVVRFKKAPSIGKEFESIPLRELGNYAFPKFMITFLKENTVNLSQH